MPPRAKKRKTPPEPQVSWNDDVPDMDKHAAFTTWSTDRGVEITNVRPAKLAGRGLGLVTTSRVKKGNRILFVPQKAMFKPLANLAKEASPQAQLACSAMATCESPDDEGMAIWKATWPTDADFEHSMPMRWPDDLRELLPPSIEQPLLRQEQDCARDLEAVRAFLSSQGRSADVFRYYWSIVNSRSFHWKPPKGKAGYMVMCPFIDYINHAPSGTTCDVFQRPDGYEVIANRDYAAGEEVLATYGAHSNDKLLVHYGFICNLPVGIPNEDDDIRLDHVLLPKFTEAVRSQLQDVGFLGGYALLPASNELCFKTQVAVRAILLTCNEWEYYVANGEDLAEDHSEAVIAFVKALLREYRGDALRKHGKVHLMKSQQTSEIDDELRLLECRWRQIIDAINEFLKA
ncbi:hypothetical protein LTR53_007329 [Teratosphaeriaceae sp. CCFEE 6253]|nr:hypothetical protein LTR53_007329 [Teratosphaeriaceae sp. CCFEE 6253]